MGGRNRKSKGRTSQSQPRPEEERPEEERQEVPPVVEEAVAVQEPQGEAQAVAPPQEEPEPAQPTAAEEEPSQEEADAEAEETAETEDAEEVREGTGGEQPEPEAPEDTDMVEIAADEPESEAVVVDGTHSSSTDGGFDVVSTPALGRAAESSPPVVPKTPPPSPATAATDPAPVPTRIAAAVEVPQTTARDFAASPSVVSDEMTVPNNSMAAGSPLAARAPVRTPPTAPLMSESVSEMSVPNNSVAFASPPLSPPCGRVEGTDPLLRPVPQRPAAPAEVPDKHVKWAPSPEKTRKAPAPAAVGPKAAGENALVGAAVAAGMALFAALCRA